MKNVELPELHNYYKNFPIIIQRKKKTNENLNNGNIQNYTANPIYCDCSATSKY